MSSVKWSETIGDSSLGSGSGVQWKVVSIRPSSGVAMPIAQGCSVVAGGVEAVDPVSVSSVSVTVTSGGGQMGRVTIGSMGVVDDPAITVWSIVPTIAHSRALSSLACCLASLAFSSTSAVLGSVREGRGVFPLSSVMIDSVIVVGRYWCIIRRTGGKWLNFPVEPPKCHG